LANSDYGKVNSGFGWRNYNGGEHHPGVDIRAYLNDPIYATQAGVVEYIGPQTVGRYTLNKITVTNSDGSISGYGHTGPIAGLKRGQNVACGERIGFSDASGPVDAHLHLSYRRSAAGPMIDALSNQLHSVSRPGQ